MRDQAGSGFIELFKTSSASDLAAQMLDVSIESLLSKEVLSNASIVGMVLGSWRTAGEVRNALLAKKLLHFLAGLRSVSDSDRAQFAQRCVDDAKYRARVSEQLLLILDRLDDMQKPELLARAFRAHVLGEVTLEQFLELAMAIDRCYIGDLESLPANARPVALEATVGTRLSSSGLLELAGIPGARMGKVKCNYAVTELGLTIQRVVLGKSNVATSTAIY